jgi:hypothetical protein
MAFMRAYSEAGDPRRRTMRAGRLGGTHQLIVAAHGFRNRRVNARLKRREMARVNRVLAAGGDPFRFKMPKFVRKLSLKKIVKSVGTLAKQALPIVAPFVPGVGPLLAPILGSFSGGGGPDSPAPELVMNPDPTGTVGENTRSTYEVPGVEVSAPRYRDDEADDYEADEYDDEDDDQDYDQDLADSLTYEDEDY